MANSITQIVKLDRETVDAIKRLAKAVEHSNQLMIEKQRAARVLPQGVVFDYAVGDTEEETTPSNEELDERIRRESGVDLDKQMMEQGFRGVGSDPNLGR